LGCLHLHILFLVVVCKRKASKISSYNVAMLQSVYPDKVDGGPSFQVVTNEKAGGESGKRQAGYSTI
jgi:hypothetical protein